MIYRIKIAIILFAIFLNNNIFSDEDVQIVNQSELRANKKYQISLNPFYATFRNFRDGRVNSLDFVYNLNSKISIGVSYQTRDFSRDQINRGYVPIQTGGMGLSYNSIHVEKNYQAGSLFLRYFANEQIPLYFLGGIRRVFSAEVGSGIFLGAIDSRLRFTPPNAIYLSTIDLSPYYSFLYGLGWQWVFQNGLFMNFELNAKKDFLKRANAHSYTSTSDMSQQNLTSLLIARFQNENFAKRLAEQDFGTQLYLQFWFGYAF